MKERQQKTYSLSEKYIFLQKSNFERDIPFLNVKAI